MTTVLKLWFSTIAATFASVGALFIFAIIYACLLVAAYIFISIQEATIWQVFATYALMVLIPIGFFILQASIINRVFDQKFRWRVILVDTVKFLAVSIPLLLVVWLLYYLLSKLSGQTTASIDRANATADATTNAAASLAKSDFCHAAFSAVGCSVSAYGDSSLDRCSRRWIPHSV
jgi:hypothetical protein